MTDQKHIGWTDYPLEELGDTPGVEAPIRRVELLSYDQNKYMRVRVLEHDLAVEIKAGYVYAQKGRDGDVPVYDIPPEFYHDYRRAERSLVQIAYKGGRDLIVFVPAWNPHKAITIPRGLVPDALLTDLQNGDYLIAGVNIGAKSFDELFFVDFEPAPEPAEIEL